MLGIGGSFGNVTKTVTPGQTPLLKWFCNG